MAKERYWSKKVENKKWDYIVIGSGMGGMITAAMLSHFGKKVLVLEQHYVPGGFTHTFRRKGYEWDVGVHAVGEVTMHTLPGRILHSLTNGTLEWASLGKIYEEMYYPDFKIEFPDNKKQFRENLVQAFPDEEEAIDKYLGLVKKVSRSMRPYFMSKILPKWASGLGNAALAKEAQRYLSMRTKDVIEGLTDNYKLKQIFVAQWGYYGLKNLAAQGETGTEALMYRPALNDGERFVASMWRYGVIFLQVL